jgi:hypothetical protein
MAAIFRDTRPGTRRRAGLRDLTTLPEDWLVYARPNLVLNGERRDLITWLCIAM